MDNNAIEIIFKKTTASTKIEICPATEITKKINLPMTKFSDFRSAVQ
jgi:hypothetical protein